MSTGRSAAEYIAGLAVKGERFERLLKEEGADFNSFALSFAQEQLWFLDQLMPDSPLYNMAVAVRLTGALDAAEFEKAFKRIIERHEVLRTAFVSVCGQAVQIISPVLDWSLPVVNLGYLPGRDRDGEARRLAREEAQKPFSLAQGPLMRATLLRLDEEDHVLLLTMHHIISDGWSVSVLFRELKSYLEASEGDGQATLEELPIQYADYAIWQRDWLRGAILEEQVAYWKKKLSGSLPLELPTDRPRPLVQSFRGERLALDFSASLSERLRVLARLEGVTLFVALLAGFKMLIHCYTGHRDIIVATSVANRNRPEVEKLIGCFINTLALRTDLSGDPTFHELLRRVRDVSVGAFAYQDLPFGKLIAELRPDRTSSYAPLTPVGFTLQNAPADDLKLAGLTLSPFKVTDTTTAKTDLMLYLVDRPEGITGTIEYSTDLFDAATIERLIDHFQLLLEMVVEDPHKPLSALPVLIGGATRDKETPQAGSQASNPLAGSNLTRSQLLYWTGQKLRPDAPLFNMINAFVVSSGIDAGHFQNAFQTLINSSDALRMVICEVDGMPRQSVRYRIPYQLEIIDLSQAADSEAELEKWLEERRKTVFDLRERLFESALIKLSDERFVWYINHHQLIGDAWATFLMYERLSRFYDLSLKGELPEVIELPQFRKYLEHERAYRQSPRFLRVEAYWRERLARPAEQMAIYGKVPERPTTRGQRVPCPLGRERSRKLRRVAAQKSIFVATEDFSQFSIFAALLFAYLYRISGSSRLSIRVLQHNRLTKEFRETIGMFMEALPLEVEIKEGETFLSLIRKVSIEALENLKHGQHTILRPAQHKTFEVALNYINAPFPSFYGAPVAVNWVHPGHQNEILDFHVRKLDSSGELMLEFDFDCDAFSDDQQSVAIQHFLRMVDALLDDLSCPVDRPDLFLTSTQIQRISSLEGEATFDF